LRSHLHPVSSVLGLMLLLAGCGSGAAGDRAWERGDYAEAIAEYRACEQLEAPRRLRLARALAGAGEIDAAVAELQALPEGAWTADGFMAQGLIYMAQGLPGQAAMAFSTGVQLGGDADLRVNHCGALLAAGTPDASVCSEALIAAPTDPAAMLGLAAAALAEGNSMVVERTLTNLLANPEVSEHQIHEAGRLYLATGDAARACGAFVQAGGGGVEGGQACAAAGRLDQAQALLEPIADQPRAAFMLGTMALERALAQGSQAERQRSIADAWRRFRTCGDHFEDDANWHNNVGRLHALDSEEQRAEIAFRRAMELDPSAPYPVLNLARLLEARGDLVESGKLLERVAGLGGLTGAIAGLDLARRARAEGRHDDGIARARVVLESCMGEQAVPCAVESCVVLATMLAASEPQQAIVLLERAVEMGGPGVVERLRAEPDLQPLAAHERFAAIVGSAP
jgi:tetratricopeptide (TPR) repeat protein